MNENYIIDGNAVYEIDSDCEALIGSRDRHDSKVETHMLLKNENIKESKEEGVEEKVSVF